MHAHLVQLDIAWEDPQTNFERVDQLLAAASVTKGDLVVLPELFDTGFSLHTQVTADSSNQTLNYLTNTAGRLGVTLVGGRTIIPSGKTRALNTMSVIGPDSLTRCTYAKIHPFSFGREGEAFDAGDEVVTFCWDGPTPPLVCCPVICYDLRFPELFRLGIKKGAQLFTVGANWPSARQHHWRSLLVARAIENQAFVLGVNRTGDDPHLSYEGGSMVVDPKGNIIAQAGNSECVISCAIDPAAVLDWRAEFPAIRDLRLI